LTPPPLAGRAVLVLRPRDRAAEVVRRLEELGARVVHVPVVAFAPPEDPAPALAALAGLGSYDVVVFTSVTGVRAFTTGVADVVPHGLRTAAVGPATATALRAEQIEPTLVAEAGRIEGLREELERLDPPPRRFLVVGPERRKGSVFDALRAAGARVDEVGFYRTVAAEGAEEAARVLASIPIDAVVFTSPSTLECLLASAPCGRKECAELLRVRRRIAIGPATAEALAAAELPAHATADGPDPEAIAAAVVLALRTGGGVCYQTTPLT
jgi:uroporphyrinogen-III synthase